MKDEETGEAQNNYNSVEEIKIERPKRAKLSPEESLKRMRDFEERKDQFIASIRKSKG
jgi:hypothetical protein